MQKTILFDTNVLIDFWKNSAKLKELELSKEKYAICGVVRSEFLHGAKSNSEIDDMLKIFASFSNLPNDDYDFDGVGFMLQNLRKNGYMIPFSEKLRIKSGLKRVDKIIVPSYFVKKDLKRIGINQEKIIVVHSGVNHSLFYPQEVITAETEMIKPFAIRRPYFLYASTMSSPFKRHIELIKAFEIFKKKTALPHRLVLAGNEGACSESIKKAAVSSAFASDIFITGYFPHESFSSLYAGSEGCLFPSEIEGVGLPVLEAMATGIPVACSKSGALQELAGEKAILFDSTDIEDMATAIEKIAVDTNLRKKMIKEGINWAKKFSWEQTARETIDVLKSVAEK